MRELISMACTGARIGGGNLELRYYRYGRQIYSCLVIDRRLPPRSMRAHPTGGVFKSTNGGGTWRDINSGLTQMTIYALAIDPAAPSRLYAVRLAAVCSRAQMAGYLERANQGLTESDISSLAIDPATPARSMQARLVWCVQEHGWGAELERVQPRSGWQLCASTCA